MSADSASALTGASFERAEDRARRVNGRALVVAGAAIVGGTVLLVDAVSVRQAALFLVGVAAGVTLYHAAFGFTTAWRVFVTDRRGAGLRAQMLMLALACSVFVPILAAGQPVLGQVPRGALAPVGVALLAGAFLFGVGMQIGGGCASGTLYTVGGGNTRMLVTLAAFIAGSLLGTAHAPWWDRTPAFPPVSLVAVAGPAGALAASLVVFGLMAALTAALERRRHGRLLPGAVDAGSGDGHWLRGPWPLVWGAVGLALVNVATLVLAGRPWGITGAFALWGAKIAAALGVDVASWPYWSAPARAASLAAPVIADVTSVMNAGIVLGALAAAALAGRFQPGWRTSPRSLAAALVGGLLLGYGARLASGCNIGAYFSGVASASLHGYVWFLAALAGTVAGTRLRPLFGLGVERCGSGDRGPACPHATAEP
jgi:uncharacterized membrane protein YedE/YeeE